MISMAALLQVIAKGDASGLGTVTKGLDAVKKAGENTNKSLGGIGNILGAVTGGVVALGAGLSAAGLVAFAKGAIDAADNMRDLSQQTGASVENLSRFQQAANMSGTDIDAVGNAMVKLSKGMNEAATTGKGPAADALRYLGISAVDASGQLRGADQVMLDVSERFNQMPDGAQKAALAVQLFGKAGAEMIPMLNEGRQSIEGLDATMTTAFAQKADAYNDSLAAMGAVFGQIGMAIAEQLLPYMTSAIAYLGTLGMGIKTWLVDNKDKIQQTIDTIGKIGSAIAPWILGIGSVVIAYQALSNAIKGAILLQTILKAVTLDWKTLLISGIVGGGAFLGIKKVLDDITASTKGAGFNTKEWTDFAEKLRTSLSYVPPEINDATQQQEAFKAAVEQSNAYYERLSRTVEATSQQVQRQGQLKQETLTADIAVHNAAKSILEAKLSQARTDAEKIPILKQIQGIELENARLQKVAAEEQIAAEVRITDLKRQKAWEEYRSADAALKTALAYGQQTEKLQEQLNLKKVAANSADLDYKLQQKIAAEKNRANQANFQAQQTQILSRQIGSGATVQRNPAGGLKPMGYINGVPYWQQEPIGYATGAYVTQATPAVFGEAGPEYAIPASKMRSASLAYLNGARGAAVLQGGGGGSSGPQITIQTGQVLQLPDGSQWVTMTDLEQAMRATAAGVLGQLRSPTGRVAMGGA